MPNRRGQHCKGRRITIDLEKQLITLAERCGFRHNWKTEEGLCFSFGDSIFPFWLVADLSGDVRFLGHVRTYGLTGCRTDLHDWIGVLWSACLRVLNVSSVWLVDEFGFAIDDEIYSRYVIFRQPAIVGYSTKLEVDGVLSLFKACAIFGEMLSCIWCSAKISENDKWVYDIADMPKRLQLLCSSRAASKNAIYGTRSDCVSYYRNCSTDISVTDFSKCYAWRSLWSFFSEQLKANMGESNDAHLLHSGRIRNVIWKKAEETLSKLAIRVFGISREYIRLVPSDSHLFAITPLGVCSKRIASGAEAYADQIEHLRRQHARNEAFLCHDVKFQWNVSIDPARVETLMSELLQNHPDVLRVKRVGHCNEPDGGRDMIVDAYRDLIKCNTALKNDNLNKPERLIVQCKVRARNVGKSDVLDIHDMIDQHQAAGMLLVAFPGMTRSLLDYIELIRAKQLFLIECWTKTDIETQLRENIGVARNYRDLFEILPPEMII